jgi:hypothetical protein
VLTTPILVSTVFVAACAVFAVTFIGARGGLQLPVASRGAAAVTSGEPTEGVGVTEPAVTTRPTDVPTAEPTIVPSPPLQPPTAAPTASATPPATPPAPAATFAPTFARPTLEPGDPLLALPRCTHHPGCVIYVVARGDTLSGIISRYLLDFDVLVVLNPEMDNADVIVVGQTLYLGRDPYARLEPCRDGTACYRYVVRAGDSIPEIAAVFGLSGEAIIAANPNLPRPIVAGDIVRLPIPA